LEKKSIAAVLNEHFASIGQRLADKLSAAVPFFHLLVMIQPVPGFVFMKSTNHLSMDS
jgi:hypothetical protein